MLLFAQTRLATVRDQSFFAKIVFLHDLTTETKHILKIIRFYPKQRRVLGRNNNFEFFTKLFVKNSETTTSFTAAFITVKTR